MRQIKSLAWLGLVIGTLFLSACGSTAQIASSSASSRNVSPPRPTAEAPTPTNTTTVQEQGVIPAQLLIPRISLHAQVEEVGLNSGGEMATPGRRPWDGVGWYSAGVRPGERGSAVIDGHLDRPGGLPAVFWNLRKLQPGDPITVVATTGQSLHFRVLRVSAYPPTAAPLQQIFGDSGGTYLNLITCAGTWIPSQHQTTLRLVVYAVMV